MSYALGARIRSSRGTLACMCLLLHARVRLVAGYDVGELNHHVHLLGKRSKRRHDGNP